MRRAATLALLASACAATPTQQETWRGLACARLTSGQITCQGHTEDFHPIRGIWRPFDSAAPVLMAGLDDAAQLALAWQDVYVLRDDDTLWRWEGPALTHPPSPAPSPPHAIRRLISGERLCADLDDGLTWCLYEGRWDPKPPPPPRLLRWEEPGGILALAAHGATRCALNGEGALACYGWLSGRWETGPARDLHLEGVSGHRACLIDARGDTRCFARGVERTSASPAPTPPCALTDRGALRCDGSGPLAALAPQGEGFVELVLDALYGCARDAQGVTCWGEAHNGELGDPTLTRGQHRVPIPPARALVTTGGAVCALLHAGQVTCWGSSSIVDPDAPQTRLPPTLQPGLSEIEALTAGSGFACGLRQGAALCWGSTPE
jgi:hypothetical protein